MVTRFLLASFLALALLSAPIAGVSAEPGNPTEFIEKIVPLSWNPRNASERDHRALCAMYAATNFEVYIALSPHPDPDRSNENAALRLLFLGCLMERY